MIPSHWGKRSSTGWGRRYPHLRPQGHLLSLPCTASLDSQKGLGPSEGAQFSAWWGGVLLGPRLQLWFQMSINHFWQCSKEQRVSITHNHTFGPSSSCPYSDIHITT